MRQFFLRSVLLPSAAIGVFLAAPAGAQNPKQAPAPMVASKPVAKAGLEQRELRAQLLPRRFTTLAAEIGAKIQHLSVQEGAAFRQGQVLVSFDCTLPQTQLDRAKASLAGVNKTWEANKRLSELNAVGKVELELSEAEVNKNRAEVAATSAILSKCRVIAPFSGRVAEQKVREQQYVQAGQALMEIIDDSVLELEFIVPSKWLAWLKVGYGFPVTIDETTKTYPAKVLRIGARVDPVSQSVKLVAAIDGKFPELISGMSGQVKLLPPDATTSK